MNKDYDIGIQLHFFTQPLYAYVQYNYDMDVLHIPIRSGFMIDGDYYHFTKKGFWKKLSSHPQTIMYGITNAESFPTSN